MKRLVLLSALACFAGCDGGGPPPYGFDVQPEQRFVLEAEDVTEIEGTRVLVQRYAQFRLVSEPVDSGGTALDVYLERYYESVDGAETGSELAISDQGIVVRGGKQGELRLGPEDKTPTAPSVAKLLERSLGGTIVLSSGEASGPGWHSYDPLLAEIDPLAWWLLSAPLVERGGATTWDGSREVPRIGQYRLGLELPLRYERLSPDPESTVRAAGFARREALRLTEELQGRLELDFKGEAELAPDGRMSKATSELALRFTADDGGTISSTHRVRIRSDSINSDSAAPDQRKQ
jgi:hypothetical protein